MKKNINLVASLNNDMITDYIVSDNFLSLIENNSLLIDLDLYDKIHKDLPKCQIIILCDDNKKINKGCYTVSNIETGINIANKKM